MHRRCSISAALGLVTAIALVVPASLAAGNPATVSRAATGLAARNDAVFPATIVEGGKELGRTRVVWSSATESGRKANYAVTYSFGNQVQGVKAPSTIRALYYDRVTNTNVLTPLAFIRQTETTSVPATETERFFHVSTHPDDYPLFKGARLPFSAAVPSTTDSDVADALLASMYYDSSIYSIVGAAWDGPMIDSGDGYGRWAVYTLRRTGTEYSAIYSANVSLPDVRVYNGVAYYSADATAVIRAKAIEPSNTTITTSAQPVPHDSAAQPPRDIWPYIAAAAAALAATGLVVFWYRRGKKRALDADEDEDDFAADESHDPGADEEGR